jgi:hypothetical protein
MERGGNLKNLQLQFTITPLLFIYKLVQGHKYKLISKSLILHFFSIKNIIVFQAILGLFVELLNSWDNPQK